VKKLLGESITLGLIRDSFEAWYVAREKDLTIMFDFVPRRVTNQDIKSSTLA
jgi:hypothetical protein